jgi:hypothetical protein
LKFKLYFCLGLAYTPNWETTWLKRFSNDTRWEGAYGANTVYTYIHVNGKLRPVETVPGMGGGESKGERWRGWIQLWYIVKTFVNVTVYPYPAQ